MTQCGIQSIIQRSTDGEIRYSVDLGVRVTVHEDALGASHVCSVQKEGVSREQRQDALASLQGCCGCYLEICFGDVRKVEGQAQFDSW